MGIPTTPRSSPAALDLLHHSKDARVVINISGLIFETRARTLERFPLTLLGDPGRRIQHYDSETNQYFFERDRRSFEAILSYYRNGGKIRRPEDVQLETFLQEMKFFDLGEDALRKLFKREHLFGHRHKEPSNPLQKKIWRIVEDPGSSTGAVWYSIFNVIVVLISVTALCVQSLPSLHTAINLTIGGEVFVMRADEIGLSNYPQAQPFFGIESACIAWFCFDLGLRFAVSPEKTQFFCKFRNWFDFFVITPYFINFILYATCHIMTAPLIRALFRVVRIIRVSRLLKITRQIKGMQVFMYTIRAAAGELLLLVTLVSVFVIIFSTAMYYAECDFPASNFTSIPGTFYWAVITMTTVGYGDNIPSAPLGQFVATLCGIFGVVLFSLSVPAMARKFDDIYHRLHNEDKIREILNAQPELWDATESTPKNVAPLNWSRHRLSSTLMGKLQMKLPRLRISDRGESIATITLHEHVEEAPYLDGYVHISPAERSAESFA